MTKARGVVQAFDPSQVAGIDTRVWQEKGTSSDNRGVYFSLKGEVVSASGIRPLVRRWQKEPGGRKAVPFTYDPFPLSITAIGTFTREGRTDILIECNGKISLVEGDTITDILTGRHVPENPSESTRFLQVANNLLILNGRDPNMKWDGEKATPLGIAGTPRAPEIVGQTDGDNDIAISAWRKGVFWSGQSIKKTETKRTYQYKLSWISEFGQESELSPASSSQNDDSLVEDIQYMLLVGNLEGPAPQDDIIGRNLYRSMDAIKYDLLRYLPGTDGDTYIDTLEPDAPLVDTAPDANTNGPPPLCSFAFYFRGRTYYSGNLENPTAIWYSKDQGGKEAVPVENFVLLGTNAADRITGFALASDFVLVFKESSTYMLTQDKEGKPILTPISTTTGAVSDRAAIGFEGKVYFISRTGVCAFDGSKVVPISKDISEIIKKIPRDTLKNSLAWVDPANRRIYFSIATGPKSHNNEVWAIHVDNGALSRVEVAVTAAAEYKGMTLVGYNSHVDFGPATPTTTIASGLGYNPGVNELGVWGCGTSVYYFDHLAGALLTSASSIKNVLAKPPMKSVSMERNFETRWFYGGSPQSDKTFYRVDVFYVQTGGHQVENIPLKTEGFDNRIYVKWLTNWDRNVVGEDYLTPADPEALLWDEALLDDLGNQTGPMRWIDVAEPALGPHKPWDEKRVRCKRINIRITDPLDPLDHLHAGSRLKSQLIDTESDRSGEHITAKSLKLVFSGGGDAGWRIVGFLIHMKDHGIRSEGTDNE